MNPTAGPRTIRADGWIVTDPRPAAPAARLFCLPHAAGGSSVYAEWFGAFGPDVEVCSVELPGRQTRWRDDPFTAMGPLVDALATAVAGELDRPYALFGHSMGALVAFELARTIRTRRLRLPRLLLVSGANPPQWTRTRPAVHDQPDERVVAELRSLVDFPDDVYDEPELLELLMPAIRADLAVCETYAHRVEPPLGCPIVAFAGDEDREAPQQRVADWSAHTSASFERHVLPGGHFFLRTARDPLLDAVGSALASTLHDPIADDSRPSTVDASRGAR